MHTLSVAEMISLLKEFWYIIFPLAVLVIAVLIAALVLFARAVRQAREDVEVKKARRRDREAEWKKAEEIAAREAAAEDEEKRRSLKKGVAISSDEDEEETDGADGTAEEEGIITRKAEMEEEVIEVTDKNNAGKQAKAVYRVIYDRENREWMIKKDGATRVIRRVKTKAEALELANQFATNQDLSLSVQKKDGKFQKKSHYSKMMQTEDEK